MTSLIPARTQSELLEVNRHFYNALWSDARLIEPERFNTWPLVRSLLAPAQRRLEVAPGLRPRLPIEDTQFIDISVAALEKLRARRLRDARLHHGPALRQCGFRPDLRLRCDRARRRRRARPGGALARGGVGGRADHVGAAASREVVGVRRLRRPPAPLRADGIEGEARAARLRGRAQRRLRDDAEILAFGGPRHVVLDSPARTGNVDLQPRDDAPGRALSKTAGARAGPHRHRRGRGSPAAVPAPRLER